MSETKPKHLRPSDIPLIITSTNSNPEFARKGSESNPLLAEEPPPDQCQRKNKPVQDEYGKRGDRKSLGGSLKYDIGRQSVGSIIPVKAKWSSVRVRGTGYNDSRKSVVKIEPCNGIGSMGSPEYKNLINGQRDVTEVEGVSIMCACHLLLLGPLHCYHCVFTCYREELISYYGRLKKNNLKEN